MATPNESPEPTASIVKEFANLLRALPRGLKPWLGLAGVFFGGALAWLVVVSGKEPGAVAVVPALMLFAVSFVTILYTLARLRRATSGVSESLAAELTSGVSDTLAEEIVDSVVLQVSEDLSEGYSRFPLEGSLIGIWFGRRSVICGALSVSGARSARLPGPRNYKELFAPIERTFDSDSEEAKFTAGAEIIKEVCRQVREIDRDLPIEAIGIGAPGFHNLTEKIIAKSVEGMLSGTHLIEELASRLSRDTAVGGLLRRSEAADIADMCYIDNDVRCVARRAISQHREDIGWDDYACIYIGSGVGAALVLDRSLYYGPHFWSGEIGHIDLGIESATVLLGDLGVAGQLPLGDGSDGWLPPQVCTCEHIGYHFESLVNYNGLAAVAKCVDPQRYAAIERAFRASDESWDDNKIRRMGWPVLVGCAGHAAPISRDVQAVVGTLDNEAYLTQVREIYTTLIAGGVSTIVSLLDIEKFILIGSLIETLHKVSSFEDKLKRALAVRLQPPRAIDFHVRSASEEIWKGAALLARDRDYLRVRDSTYLTEDLEPN